MIRANCRIQFTADDFEFVVQTLSRSQNDAVSLVQLLSDEQTRDSILDHELIFQKLVDSPACLNVSSHFYFYVLTRRVLKDARIEDRQVSDYLAAMLTEFSRTANLNSIPEWLEMSFHYISDMLLVLQNSSSERAFLIRSHIGNYSLFISGMFAENVEQRAKYRHTPPLSFYETIGSSNYRVISHHRLAKDHELGEVYDCLSDRFHTVRLALNQLSERFINLGDSTPDLGSLHLKSPHQNHPESHS